MMFTPQTWRSAVWNRSCENGMRISAVQPSSSVETAASHTASHVSSSDESLKSTPSPSVPAAETWNQAPVSRSQQGIEADGDRVGDALGVAVAARQPPGDARRLASRTSARRRRSRHRRRGCGPRSPAWRACPRPGPSAGTLRPASRGPSRRRRAGRRARSCPAARTAVSSRLPAAGALRTGAETPPCPRTLDGIDRQTKPTRESRNG